MKARLRLLALATVRRRALLNVLFAIGLEQTCASLIGLLNKNAPSNLAPLLLLSLAVGVPLAVWRALPPTAVTLRHATLPSSVVMEHGDLLAVSDGPIVVTTNLHFDVDKKSIAGASLVSQLVSGWYGGDDTPLRESLGHVPGMPGRAEEATVGSIVEVSVEDRSALLLAVSKRDTAARSAVVVNDVWIALSHLWDHCRRSDYARLSTPIIGAGFSRARVAEAPLLMLLITSYVTASLERPVCDLRIVLHGDIGSRFKLMELGVDYFAKLGFGGGS